MDAVESNYNLIDLKAEITKTRKLIEKLDEAQNPIIQRLNTITEEIYGIKRNKHRRLQEWIKDLREEIVCLEQFPRLPYCEIEIHSRTPFSTPKELAEPIQRLKIQFHHNNKNLATERKMARELQRRERERQEHDEVGVDEENTTMNSYHGPRKFRGLRPLPNNMPIKTSIKIWAEKVEYVSSLVLRDSKNLTMTRQTWANLKDLRATRAQLNWQLNIGKAEFRKHLDSIKRTKNSIEHIEFDLIKASTRHQEGYAKTRPEEKILEMEKLLAKVREESDKISSERSKARKFLSKLKSRYNSMLKPILIDVELSNKYCIVPWVVPGH